MILKLDKAEAFVGVSKIKNDLINGKSCASWHSLLER